MSTLPLGPASELDAVNEMLAAIGEDPASSLDFLPPSGNTALHLLRETSRSVQSEGYWFNTERDYPLTPGEDRRIAVPSNVIDLDGVEPGVIQRGSYLYDTNARSYQFSAPMFCDVTIFLPWNELPTAAKWAITASATERFCEAFPGTPGVTEARDRNIRRAFAALRRAEAINGDHNILSNSHFLSMSRRS